MSASETLRGHRLRLGFIGWGAVATLDAELLAVRKAPVDIVVIAVRDASKARLSLPARAHLIASPAELRGLDLDMIIEAASRSSAPIWAEAARRCARRFVVSSTSAFCDDEFLAHLIAIARETDSQITVPAGALGGMGALAGASCLQLDMVTHSIIKPPLAWRGTKAETVLDLESLAERTVLFSGSARKAAESFPQNANSAVISELAGIGLDRTQVELVSDPAASRNCHRLRATGAFGRMDMLFENEPLKANAKSSETTSLNLVRLIENQVALFLC
jgi:aspartate dehydrogenase